jgi:hypothetical protein
MPHAAPRLILLLGTPRSGTTWLATILNSYPEALYCHEPLDRLHSPQLDHLIAKLMSGAALDDEERQDILQEWSRAHHDCQRPPFFAKSFLRSPGWARLAAWLAVRVLGVGQGAFRYLFSPAAEEQFELVVKNVDWSRHVGRIVRGLEPVLVLIMRHPCGVVASLLRGQGLGLMAKRDRGRWLEQHKALCDRLGFGAAGVRRMEPWEFLSLEWLVQNVEYLEVLGTHRPCRLVVYEDLCRAPEIVTRDLFDFLGWEMGPQTRRFLRTNTSASSSLLSDWLQAKHPYFSVRKNSRRAAASWRTQLRPRQQEQILTIARAFPRFDDYWPSRFPGPEETGPPFRPFPAG